MSIIFRNYNNIKNLSNFSLHMIWNKSNLNFLSVWLNSLDFASFFIILQQALHLYVDNPNSLTMSKCILIILWFTLFHATECLKVMKAFNHTTHIMPPNQKVKYHQSDLGYSPSEEKLLKYLFKEYNPHIMPIENLNESLKLYIGLAMGQLINIVILSLHALTANWV